MPGAEQTLGVVTIHPGKRNPFHSHPNREELLYVVSGEGEHKLGDEVFHLTPGAVIHIPRGVRRAACGVRDVDDRARRAAVGEGTSVEPLVAVVSFSSPDRRTDSYGGDEMA